MSVSGSKIGARRRDLAELHEHATRALQDNPHPTCQIRRGQGGGIAVPHVEEVLAARVADHLAKTLERSQHHSRRPQGMAQRVAPSGAPPPAPRDDIDHDRHRQRRQYPEEHRQDNDQPRVVHMLRPKRDHAADQANEPAHARSKIMRQRPMLIPSTRPVSTPIAAIQNGRINT